MIKHGPAFMYDKNDRSINSWQKTNIFDFAWRRTKWKASSLELREKSNKLFRVMPPVYQLVINEPVKSLIRRAKRQRQDRHQCWVASESVIFQSENCKVVGFTASNALRGKERGREKETETSVLAMGPGALGFWQSTEKFCESGTRGKGKERREGKGEIERRGRRRGREI